MTDLRKAAEMALEFVSWFASDDHSVRPKHKAPEIAEALRQALAQPEQDELLKQGWRQCAVGQRTTQYCGMAEQARLEEREACLKEIAIELDEWNYGTNANIALNNVAANIRARSEK